jgi:alpha-mannosidase
MWLYSENPRIDFETELDWHDHHQILKTEFPVDVHALSATYDVQYGHVSRPTHANTSWDEAKFEVYAHKWADISENGYGVALLNSGKYGLSCQGSDMRLTLKTGGVRPDPITDCGTQYMSYALLPHVGGFDAETVIRPAYDFNYKPVEIAGAFDVPALFTLSAPGVICEAVKAAEDVPGAYVLRLYEAERNGTSCVLNVSGATRVVETNMLEEPIAELPMDGEAVKLHFRPFEIKTVLVYR